MAQIAGASVAVQGVSGALSQNGTLQLTVSGIAIADPFHTVGGSLVHGFYDESRKLLFAANPGLNELDVFSGVDFSLKARVPVPQPWGIDQMPDGNTLVIGTQAQEIITLNEDTLEMVQHPFSASPIGTALFFPMVVAMANGKVLVIGHESGIDCNDIYECGQYLYEWDSNANSFSQFEPTVQNLTWEADSLARSADHKWATFSADQFYLYSSDADSLTTVPLTTVDPPQDEFGVRGYALNADGSEIAVASAKQVSFFNRSFALLGTTQLQSAFQTSRSAVQFTPDGTRLLLEYALPLWLEEIDAKSYAALGALSASMQPDQDNLERLLTLDGEGHGYAGINEGLLLLDLTQPPAPIPANSNGPNLPSCPVLQAVLPLNTSQQVPLFQTEGSLSFYVGGTPAPLLPGLTAVNVPASSVAGPVDVECVDANGEMSVTIGDVSYGVEPLALSANLLPANGNPMVYLFGFGFYGLPELDYTTEPPFQGSISINGQPVSGAVTLGSAGLAYTLGALAFHIPTGGQSADIAVSSSFGSGTLPSAARYYAPPTILPATALLQLLYDSHRNLLYALKPTEVDVLNPGTLQWQSPINFPATATGTYSSMALSPDGKYLVVAGKSGSFPQFIVFDPTGVSPPSVLAYSNNALVSGSIAITEFDVVIEPGDPGLILNLSTSAFSPLPYFGADVIRASADGAHLYTAALNVSSGEMSSIDPSTYAVQSESFAELFWTDLAVSFDGSQVAAVNAPPDAAGDIVGFFDSNLHFLNTNAYPEFSPPDDTGVLGATFSPGGKVLVVALVTRSSFGMRPAVR
jgi:DNA-binding beta-propeller fold protein YncE